MPTFVRRTTLLAAAAIGLAACSDSSGPANAGSLAVTMTSPAGVTPSVVVSGPNAYSKTITATGTLNNLKVGDYAVVADTVSVTDSVVGASINTGVVTGSPANVVAHATAQASVVYSTVGQRGGLWVANNSGTMITEFASAQLRAGGSALTPADTIGSIAKSSGVAIDGSGNLWVASYSSDTIRMYTAAQRAGGATPTPTVTIVSPSLNDPEQIAFDPSGTLWVADYANGLVGFTASQLASSGTPTAAYVVTDTTAGAGTYAVTFDASGDAWVAAFNASHLSKYMAAQLAASGSPVPTVVLDATSGSINSPSGLAFDASGNLWVANDAATVVEFTASQLGANGSPTPNITMTLPNDGDPFGIAVDNRGTVWVSDDNNSLILGIPVSQQVDGTTPGNPIVLGSNAINDPEQLVLDPFVTAAAPVAGSRVPRSTPRRVTSHNNPHDRNNH